MYYNLMYSYCRINSHWTHDTYACNFQREGLEINLLMIYDVIYMLLEISKVEIRL